MDVALERLQLAPGEDGCSGSTAATFCPDDELFERLVGELGVALAPAVRASAAPAGVVGFHVGIDTTVTAIESGAQHWTLGTRGDGDPVDRNPSPSGALIVTGVEVRKGLPLGLEVGASLARVLETSLWSFSGGLRWTLFEAPHRLPVPDVAVGGSLGTAVGAPDLDLHLATAELALSRRLGLGGEWSLAPVAGLQALHVFAESAEIAVGPAPPSAARAFAPVEHTRWRLALGAQGRHALWTLGASVMLDLVTPIMEAEPRRLGSDRAAGLWALDVSAGAAF